eukprot:gene8486-8668_t
MRERNTAQPSSHRSNGHSSSGTYEDMGSQRTKTAEKAEDYRNSHTTTSALGTVLAIGLAAFAVAYKKNRHTAYRIGIASSASTRSNLQGQAVGPEELVGDALVPPGGEADTQARCTEESQTSVRPVVLARVGTGSLSGSVSFDFVEHIVLENSSSISNRKDDRTNMFISSSGTIASYWPETGALASRKRGRRDLPL